MDFTKLRNCELFLFDMDGTLYLGDDIFEGAVELMEDFPALGKKYIYLTNNSSRAGTDYITRLKGFGFPCEAENVFTSGKCIYFRNGNRDVPEPELSRRKGLSGWDAGFSERASELWDQSRGRSGRNRRGRF